MLYFCTMSRLLAIDYGQKRVGIAVTDEEQIIASALTTLHSKEVMSFLKDYLSNEKVDLLSIRHYKDFELPDIVKNQEILIQQRSRSTIRYVFKKY